MITRAGTTMAAQDRILLLRAGNEEVVQRPEDERYVPAPDKGFDKAKAERRPGQQFKARKKNRQRRMIDLQARKDQIADHTQCIRNGQKPAQCHTKGKYRC